MPYSERVQKLLKSGGAAIGDRISVASAGKTFEGMLMPQTASGDPDKIVIKLDSGYNIGLAADSVRKLSSAKSAIKPAPGVKFDPSKPAIAIVSTGGTIGSKVDYSMGSVTTIEKPEEIIQSIPEVAGFASIRAFDRPFAKMSEDMNHEDWQEIAKAVAKHLNSGARGVIVTHGTDFLHFTSAALSFFLRNLGKPVVLVGSQRSPDRGSSDANMNLVCGAIAATANMAEVGICMHGSTSDDYCFFTRGTHCRKMDTQRRDAFRPINEPPLAKVWPDGRIERLNQNIRVRDDAKKAELDLAFEPKVALLKAYPGSDPSLMEYLVSKGYKGFIVEAGALGHIPTNGKGSWIPSVKKLVKDGIPVACATQTIYGRINPDVYTNLRVLYHEAGAIPLSDMLSEVAYIKLGWVLGHTKEMTEVRNMMLTNYAGEITDRSLDGTFLY
jgi:glutamyl-tRNA(Gln) amidotransferase subunit D